MKSKSTLGKPTSLYSIIAKRLGGVMLTTFIVGHEQFRQRWLASHWVSLASAGV